MQVPSGGEQWGDGNSLGFYGRQGMGTECSLGWRSYGCEGRFVSHLL